MSKIKETITAVSAGNEPGAVRIKREEHGFEYYRLLEVSIKCATAMIASLSLAAMVVYAQIWNLLTFFGFAIFFSLIYFGIRD